MTATLASHGLFKPKLRTIQTIQKEQKIKEARNSFLKLTFIVLGVLTLLFVIPALANADRYGEVKYAGEDYNLGALSDNFAAFVFQMIYFVECGFLDVVNNSGLLQINTGDGLWTLAKNIYDGLIGPAIGLGAVWVMLDLVEKAQMDQLTPEVFIRWGIKIMVALSIIQSGFELAGKLAEIGNEILRTVIKDSEGYSSEVLSDMYEVLKTAGFIPTLTIFIEYLIPALAMIVCTLFMLVQVFGRNIEIAARLSFMPIGLSDAFTHGINSPGIRYIKKFFAVCLQGAVLVVIMRCGMVLMTDYADVLQGFSFISSIVIAFATLGLMMKSQQIINDIVGV